MRWWGASKRYESKPGCRLRLWSGTISNLGLESDRFITDATFRGPLPRNAQDERMLTWSRSLQSIHDVSTHSRYHLLLRFGDSSLNLGEVATGPVKFTIDCLAPLLGGEPGKPEDWRIIRLQVEKGIAGIPKTGVKVLLRHVHP